MSKTGGLGAGWRCERYSSRHLGNPGQESFTHRPILLGMAFHSIARANHLLFSDKDDLIMRQQTRQFLPRPIELEARSLLATSPASQMIGYMGIDGQGEPMIYMQQDGPVTLQLYRIPTKGTVQVRVTSNPSTPAADAVVAPIDQTITFADGQSSMPMTVPINPGERIRGRSTSL